MGMGRSPEALERRAQKRLSLERIHDAHKRDVGPPPTLTPYSKKRRQSCKRDLLRFISLYLISLFETGGRHYPFSADHLEVIAELQKVILGGGRVVVAMPRGHGKTILMIAAVLWALLYGHRRFLVVLAAEQKKHARRILRMIKGELENNEKLAKDFPEVCHFIRRLGRIATRAAGQTCCGESTHIEWGGDSITLATCRKPGGGYTDASSSRVEVYGLDSAVRGTTHLTPWGEVIRPDLCLIDDPQTDKSARSQALTDSRLDTLKAAVGGMAGPGVKIAALAAVTVIEEGDLSAQLLDREKYPDWQGRKYKLLNSPPKNLPKWDEYRSVRHEGLKAGLGLAPATEFYVKNRSVLDEGASVSWRERFNPDEASAVQHAMNLMYSDEAVFAAEYQNEPLSRKDDGQLKELVADQIVLKLSKVPRGLVPLESTRLTAFIDVQHESLWYVVAAWAEDFSGDIIDYGVWPQQSRTYFRASEVSPSLSEAYSLSREANWYKGLEDLCKYLLGRVWQRHGRPEDLRIEQCLIDAGDGNSSDTIYKFVRTSDFASILFPSHGRGITASDRPIDSWSQTIGLRRGMGWRLMPPEGNRRQRHVIYDTNAWKSFVAERLQVPMGAASRLALYGTQPILHQLFADHCVSEYRELTFRKDQQSRVEVWKLRVNKPDNHWFDCLVGAAVAASVAGLVWSSATAAGQKPRPEAPPVDFSELQRAARAATAPPAPSATGAKGESKGRQLVAVPVRLGAVVDFSELQRAARSGR